MLLRADWLRRVRITVMDTLQVGKVQAVVVTQHKPHQHHIRHQANMDLRASTKLHSTNSCNKLQSRATVLATRPKPRLRHIWHRDNTDLLLDSICSKLKERLDA